MNAATDTTPASTPRLHNYFLVLAREIQGLLREAGEPCSPSEVNRQISRRLTGGNSARHWVGAAEELRLHLRGARGYSAEDEALEAEARQSEENAEWRSSLRYGSAKY